MGHKNRAPNLLMMLQKKMKMKMTKKKWHPENANTGVVLSL
jgi:hypothetical protein